MRKNGIRSAVHLGTRTTMTIKAFSNALSKSVLYSVIVAVLVTAGAATVRTLRNRYSTVGAQYVALGSSFAAGPGIAQRAPGSLLLCFQSDSNYGRLFAAREHIRIVDATCSGATTRDVLRGSRFLWRSQLASVQRDTRLVTLTVGGNDVDYIGGLVASACGDDPDAVPLSEYLLGFCRGASKKAVERGFRELPDQLHEIVTNIRSIAPHAQVIFIDYTTVLPDAGTCTQLHLTADDVAAGRRVAKHLAELTESVAAQDHVDLIKASVLTHGHDVCSNDPWVNGLVFPKKITHFGPAAFHPNARAMQAIADALERKVKLVQ